MISRALSMPRLSKIARRVVGLARVVRDQIGAAAGKDDARVRISARQRGGRDDAVGRAADHRRAMRRPTDRDRSSRPARRCRRARLARRPMAESGSPADRAADCRAARRPQSASSRIARDHEPAAERGKPRRHQQRAERRRARSGNWSAAAARRLSWTGRKTSEASAEMSGYERSYAVPSQFQRASHGPSSSAFQPRNLPLGLLRSQAEAGADHRQRRRGDRRDHQRAAPTQVPDKSKFHVPPELFEVHAKNERMVPGPHPDRADRGEGRRARRRARGRHPRRAAPAGLGLQPDPPARRHPARRFPRDAAAQHPARPQRAWSAACPGGSTCRWRRSSA